MGPGQLVSERQKPCSHVSLPSTEKGEWEAHFMGWESEHVAVESQVPQCLFWELFSAMDEEAKSPRRQSPFFHPNHSFQKQQAYPKVLKPRL